jgi:crotonobetainyl-CoA:carnitine CoA-transferase CaiB-like acyl-CoA transferase
MAGHGLEPRAEVEMTMQESTTTDDREPLGAAHWQPLAGVRVLDFSALLPGPFAAAILGDLGADVLKVEPPAGDHARAILPMMFRAANRNKRSMVLDLKQPGSAAIVERLARWADIVIETSRPGVAARIGIGFEKLAEYNPRLIYCSLSGYGQNGPWCERPGHDLNYLAAAGGLAFAGQWGRQPARSSLPIADIAGGAFATTAILAALHQASRTGRGTQLDLSLLESTLFCAGLRHGLAETADRTAHLFAANDIFETADGELITLALIEEHFWNNFRDAVRDFAPQFAAEKFGDDAGRRLHGDELGQQLRALIATRSAAEWLELLVDRDVPIELCVTPAMAAQGEHIAARGLVQEIDDERVALFPVQADGGAVPRLRSIAPDLGEHSRQVLEQLEFSTAEIDNFVAARVTR